MNRLKKIKVFSFFISFLFLIPILNFNVCATDNYIGDVDGDGIVTVSDACFMLQVAAGIQPSSRKILNLCDVDGNGDITVEDAISVLRMASGLIDLSPREDNNDIILSNMPKGSYTLKYEDENGVISSYESICTLNV